MPRAKRGTKRRTRRKKILDKASGFVLGRGVQAARTAEAVDRAGVYAYRDRRAKKRDFRQLWIARLSAALNGNDMSYSRFIGALKKADVRLDRKVLSDIAITDPTGFSAIVNDVRSMAPTQ
ncbi:MAG: 50S ribosomal protein L20 [Cryobacterium sp.]|nr:50S ribosomal protein L20 [Oligoflexia bacterium]